MKLFLLGSTLQEQRHEMSRIDGPILAENSRTIHPLYSSTVYCIVYRYCLSLSCCGCHPCSLSDISVGEEEKPVNLLTNQSGRSLNFHLFTQPLHYVLCSNDLSIV